MNRNGGPGKGERRGGSTTDRCETVPHKRRGPLRPDFNPTKNMWKELNSRLAETAPVHLEKLPEFRVRVKNVVNWLNRSREDMMRNCASSMPRRLQEAVALRGARTGC